MSPFEFGALFVGGLSIVLPVFVVLDGGSMPPLFDGLSLLTGGSLTYTNSLSFVGFAGPLPKK
jgi:hypothetical protein